MKINKKIFVLLLFFNFLNSQDNSTLSTVEIKKEKLDYGNGITFNVYINTDIKSLLKSKTSADKKDLKEVLSDTLLGGKKHLAYLGNWALQYKYIVPIAGLSCIYGLTFYKLYKLNKKINLKDSWTNWKSETSFDKLLSIQPKILAKDLLDDIQKRYLNQSHPNDFITPMFLFTTDVETDISNLEKYLKIIKVINFFKIIKIFPIIDNIDAQEKLNKLIYLKNIFSNFSVELNRQKLINNE